MWLGPITEVLNDLNENLATHIKHLNDICELAYL